MPKTRHRSRPAVSLIEVLVVIGVIGVLIGLLLTAVQAVRGAASRAGCANHLRQLGIAAMAHHDAHGFLPKPAVIMWVPEPGRAALLPWTNLLLPYIEQEALWQTLPAAYQAAPGYVNPPHVGLATVVKVYACPADGRLTAPITDKYGHTAAYGSYLGVVGYDVVANPSQRTAMNSVGYDYRQGVRLTEVTDGTSQSLLIGERPPPGWALAGNWYSLDIPNLSLPYTTGLVYGSVLSVRTPFGLGPCRGPSRFGPGRVENPCDSDHFWSLHPGGAHFLFVDGSVHFLRYSAEPILPALATRAGGEVVTLPDF
jgi:prepilin-type processing-associated H-X9-DG protein